MPVDETDQPDPAAPEPRPQPRPQPSARPGTPARARRTPRYSVFLLTGALLGLLGGLALATFGAAPTATGGAGVLGYFAAMGAFLGALAGGTVAVVAESVLDRRRNRRRTGGR